LIQLNRNFYYRFLALLGFNSTWIQWIRQCTTTTSFSVMIDGAPFGKFLSSRGLRQGDPLSPFLFILGSEILLRIILRAENRGLLHGIKMSRLCPAISHLFFVDDVMIFSRASVREAEVLINCLDTYSSWSGQHINMAKSTVFFSKNCWPATRVSINGILNLAHILTRVKYLGIPLFLKRRKNDSFIELKDRIC
jgi:hypothetical protein